MAKSAVGKFLDRYRPVVDSVGMLVYQRLPAQELLDAIRKDDPTTEHEEAEAVPTKKRGRPAKKTTVARSHKKKKTSPIPIAGPDAAA